MHSTGYPDSVAIDITITDPGGSQGSFFPCDKIGVVGNGRIVALFDRHPFTTITRHVVDTDVQPNTMYWYAMALFADSPVGLLDCGSEVFCNVFYDCHVQTVVNTGPDPAFIGHGFLETNYADDNEVKAFLAPCEPGPVGQNRIALHVISGTAQQYVDSGIAVNLYGAPWCCWAQHVWLLEAQAATPAPCVVATEQKSWGAVKALYRK
jgi:hypothetical protein